METLDTKLEVSMEKLRDKYSPRELNRIEDAINFALDLVLGRNADQVDVKM